MAFDEYQQARTHLGSSRNILIIAGIRDIEDTYPASIALARVLRQNKKEVAIFAPRAIPGHFYFLKGESLLQPAIGAAQDVVVSIDVSKKPVQRMSYNNSSSRLDIHVIPSPGVRLEERDIHINLSKFNYDSIVTLGVDDLGTLEEEFERNATLFYETPIINLDKSSSNERYGEVNIIEPTRSSCSEIMAALIKKWDESLMTKEVATSLLAGIIAATGNFQNSRTKPNALYEAAYLMSREADQQEVIKHLFKTKSFEFLKLWGISMSKLKYAEHIGLAWLTITEEDFSESGTDAKSIPLILSELRNNFAQASSLIIFWENRSRYFGVAYAGHEEQLKLIRKLVLGEKRGINVVFAIPSNDIGGREKIISAVSYELEKSKI